MSDVPAPVAGPQVPIPALPAAVRRFVVRHKWPLCVAFAVALSLFRAWPFLSGVWTTGVFNDTDDAMRMVQVRALMAGQSWFDMTAYRMDPPAGIVMHWSRVVDVPIALLVSVFSLVAAPERAELLARLAFPLLLTIGFVLAVARAARFLGGDDARYTAALLAVLANAIAQFVPGRIDHHAPQIVLLVLVYGLLAEAIAGRADRSFRSAATAGVLAAVSLAISLENLPFLAVAFAGVALSWVAYGADARRALTGLATGLGVGLPVLLLATVGPAHWFAPACDAYSTAFLIVGLAGAAVLGGLGLATRRLASMSGRLALTLVGGAAVAAVFVLGFPGCLHDPLGSSDPLIALWLRNIQEGQPLPVVVSRDPLRAMAALVPNGLAIAAAVWTARGLRGRERAPWLLGAALIAIGIAGSCWQIRVDTSTSALSAIVGAGFAARVALRVADPTRLGSRVTYAIAIGLPFTILPISLIPDASQANATKATGATDVTCDRPADFAGLRTLPPALLFGAIDEGSYILAHTDHAVVAASYHRAARKNRLVLQAFMASPAEAEAPVRASGSRYLVFCPTLGEIGFYKKQAPQGLAAALTDGRVPDWLVPVDVPGPFKVYTLRDATAAR